MIKEAKIIINGIDVGLAGALTIRVALEVFYSELESHGPIKDSVDDLYMKRINDLRKIMSCND